MDALAHLEVVHERETQAGRTAQYAVAMAIAERVSGSSTRR